MKRTNLALILTLIWVLTSCQGKKITSKQAPHIISTIPAFGDCNVDPALNEIILKFDQDMYTTTSVINSRDMPKITGKPKWMDKRTLSIPVQLDSNKLYALNFNDWKHRNFRNIGGRSLNPENLYFKTKGQVDDDVFNKTTYDEFLKVFPKRYSYASLKGIDWKNEIEQHKSEMLNSKSDLEFTLKVLQILKKANDIHMSVDYDGQKFYSYSGDFHVLNFNMKYNLEKLQDKIISDNKIVVSGNYHDIGYIFIGSWGVNAEDDILTAFDRLAEFKSLKNIIIDVRANGGGNERFAKAFAACFVKDSLSYKKVKVYDESTGEFDKESIKKVYANKKGFDYCGNVYVLTGPGIVSSDESFVMMMQQMPNVKTIGMKTRGSSGNPLPYKLSNDITLFLPSWQVYSLDDKLLEGNGVSPDIEVINSQREFKGNDPLFDKVVSLIEKMSKVE